MNVELYDTTLRDGAGMEGISLSVEDKIKIARKLDSLGIHYIEGGYPGSNQKDAEFFARASAIGLRNATLVAFGSTRRAGARVGDDANLRALLESGATHVTLVGKAWDRQVEEVLETSLEENLAMIADSIEYLRAEGRTVFFDAEHFFDGFRGNPDYALQCLRTAARAGARVSVLCDTNGGTMPEALVAAIRAAQEATPGHALGIHVHNDADLAVANSLIAFEAGAVQVQGCANGYGERCGNANIFSIIANLKLKMGVDCVSDDQLARLTEVSHYISEIANIAPDPHQPYVGASAFAHKAGLHVAALTKSADSYHHVPPERVGNDSRILVSEFSGRRNILLKMHEQGIDLPLSSEEARELLDRVKVMEARGFQYDGAEASFELLARRRMPDYRAPFSLEDFLVVERRRHRAENGEGDHNDMLAEAMVKVRVGDEVQHTAAEGNGPVNALDQATRKALVQFYPGIASVRLVDYKVRIIDTGAGTGAAVRVLIESTDGDNTWRTVGSSTDIIEASWLALADSLEYWLTKHAVPGAPIVPLT
ncbi:MAG TPA: citramalate synthase [Dehalococcoidia bacterium]|nr:citramalate synthase [Dehalococcoidia bacterium]